MDRAGKQYWNNIWLSNDNLDFIDPRLPNLNNYINLCFHKYFLKLFSGLDTSNMKLLEIGCARSKWLPYFAKEYNFEIYGIDYSEVGCEQTIKILSNEGIKGCIVCGDFFSPHPSMLNNFDIVVSFGVAEHFQDTAACIRAFSSFLKPGGIIITNIPNMIGLNGFLQKKLNKKIYDIHIPLSKESLEEAHKNTGLKIIHNDYFLIANFNVVNLYGWKHNYLYYCIVRLLSWSSKAFWIIQRYFPFLKVNKFTSPYINCIAQKPDLTMILK